MILAVDILICLGVMLLAELDNAHTVSQHNCQEDELHGLL